MRLAKNGIGIEKPTPSEPPNVPLGSLQTTIAQPSRTPFALQQVDERAYSAQE
ncbi:MAG: hypothetical protein ACI9BW_004072 [Gammaproteobacteria bacterium]|jgi:hypothetical protein